MLWAGDQLRYIFDLLVCISRIISCRDVLFDENDQSTDIKSEFIVPPEHRSKFDTRFETIKIPGIHRFRVVK